MVVELSVEREDTSGDRMVKRERWTTNELFTVHVEDYKILALFTNSDYQMKKWVSEVQKRLLNKKKAQNHPLVIGLSVDREIHYDKKGVRDNCYDILTLCTGTNCLVYTLPDEGIYHRIRRKRSEDHNDDENKHKESPVDKVLQEFLADPNVIVVGKDMAEVSAKLEKDHLMKIAKPVDAEDWKLHDQKSMRKVTALNVWSTLKDDFRYAVKTREDLDRWTDDEDRYIKQGQIRPGYYINRDYVKFQAAGAFLAHLIGMEYLEDINKIRFKKINK
ncbi:hypothetical protein ACHQM5_021949 [Ranunculus cassubicifolius]